ncbi:hypothetical protein HMPREF0851_00957 [Streptococcus sp. M334]|nr:hypothetical protein HMPREF0851_00957 [Streptococcus sp. M334]
MRQKNKPKEGLTVFFFCTILEDKCLPLSNTLRKSLQTASASPCRRYMLLTPSVLFTTSKQCFEQSVASFLVCSLIFIEYKI